MNCKRALELISAHIDEESNLLEDEALRGHLSMCRRCRQRLESLRRLDQALVRTFADDRRRDAALTDDILARLQSHDPAIQSRCTILVVDDEPAVLKVIEATLSRDYDVLLAHSAAAAQDLFRQKRIDLILTDQTMPGTTGVQLLEWVLEHYPRTVRLLMSGYDDFNTCVAAINRGQVFRYLPKPWGEHGLLPTVRDAARSAQLERNQELILKQLRHLNDELELRVVQRTRQLEEVNAELAQKNSMLERFALNDALTGLPNRRALDYLMERELRWRERYPAPLTVGLLDIDHFKDVNTRHLHSGGDKVLAELAKCLTSGLRKIDVLGRQGGEEFLLIAPQTNQAGACVLAERIRAQVEAHVFTYRDQIIPIRVSIGLAILEADVTADYVQVKGAAETALKRAKEMGRNRVEIELLLPAVLKVSTPDAGMASA
jgi:diguanylate cyclase (GGDEF)-like protein